MSNTITIIECCNFYDFPTGGQLSFAKHLLSGFGKQIILVGLTNEKKEVGKWIRKEFDGIKYDFYPYIYLPRNSKRPLVPLRLKNFFALLKHKQNIQRKASENVLTQSPETILALISFRFKNVCYCFAGVENPLKISRYKIARSISFLYDRYFLPKLSKVQIILAAADDKSINDLITRSYGCILKEKVIQFPTRVDTGIYKRLDNIVCRDSLSIPYDQLVIVTTGRLGWFKGWKFMIDTFKLFKITHSNAHFFFIGNGEDFEKINSYISSLALESSIHLIGFKNPEIIVQYLNIADLFIMGSYKEGWSTSLLEAIACGTPACVTNFSSAREIIEEGINGYVSDNRNEIHFVELMNKCLSINRERLPRKIDIDKYSVTNLREDLLKVWPLV